MDIGCLTFVGLSDLYMKLRLERFQAPELVRIAERVRDDSRLAEHVVAAIVAVAMNPKLRLVLAYLSRNLFQKLRAYAAARSQTVSAVVADALGEYLEPKESDQELLGRRLDRLTHAVEQLGRNLTALGVGFGRFVRYSLWSAPEKVDDKAVLRGDGLYRTFLSKVADQVRAGATFTGQVFPTRRPPAAPPDTTADGRDKGGRS
jgi:hypothetical protein